MKDIHVLCINYNIRGDLSKALSSLNYILSRVNKVTVFDNQYPYLSSSDSPLPLDIDYIDARKDLGVTLNDYIKAIESEYVLFLFTYEFLTPAVRDNILTFKNNKHIMTVYHENKDLYYQSPFMVKASFLKESPFLLEREVPFREMIFHLWILQNGESNIVTIKQSVIDEIRKISNITNIEKLKFAHKFKKNSPNTMSSAPTLSVMISNFNMGEFVSVAIRSCMEQSVPFDQIIIVDDGSTDNSLKFLKRYETSPNIQCHSKINEGKAKALNHILPFITSDFVLELDSDDWLDPDAVFLIKNRLGNLPSNTAVLYGNWRYWNQTPAEEVEFSRVRHGKSVNSREELLSYPFPLGPRVYQTSILKEEKGFPIVDFEQGRLYEDIAILVQLFKNYKFFYDSFTVYNVRRHNDSITKKNHSKWNDFRKFLK